MEGTELFFQFNAPAQMFMQRGHCDKINSIIERWLSSGRKAMWHVVGIEDTNVLVCTISETD